MKGKLLIGILFASAVVFIVSHASDSSPTKKADTEFSEQIIVPVAPINYELLAPAPVDFVVILDASPFSIEPIGKPATKAKCQVILYPLKLC